MGLSLILTGSDPDLADCDKPEWSGKARLQGANQLPEEMIMSKSIGPKSENAREMNPREMTRTVYRESANPHPYHREEITRLLRSADRDFHEAMRMLDSIRQSEAAGRLHALSVELRELASETENGVNVDGSDESMPGRYLQ